MKVYKMDEGEGFYLACDLEMIRKQKQNNRVTVRCDGILNNEIRQFKRAFVLDNGVTNILMKAKGYYLTVDKNDAAFCLVYNTCQIIYYFKEESDWKVIGLEVVSSDMCLDFDSCESTEVGKVAAAAFGMIAKFSHTYGYERVFDREKSRWLCDVFMAVAEIEEVIDDEFKAIERSREKIIYFLSHNAMRKDFVDNYLYRHLEYKGNIM